MSLVLKTTALLYIAVDNKDLFTSLSTQCTSIEKSIRPDVNVIRYELEHCNVSRFLWISGQENMADPDTKADSPLIDPLQLLLNYGRLPLYFPLPEISDAGRSLM